MTINHSKGPWALCPENDGAFTIWAGERQIAEIAPDDMGDTLPAKANAYLMYAAPDLLAALAPLVDHIAAMQADEAFDANTCDAGAILFGDIMSEDMARARAAIAKAKGANQ